MRKIAVIFIFYIFMLTSNATACRCQWEGPFLDVAFGCPLVAVVNIDSHYVDPDAFQTFPLAAYAEIEQVVKGEPVSPRIRIWGDDGKMCRPYISTFDTGSTWLMALYQANDTTAEYYVSICGAYYLQVEGDSVYGYIHDIEPGEPVQTMALQEIIEYSQGVLNTEKSEQQTLSFELKQNYPNPFNSNTNFEFRIAPQAGSDHRLISNFARVTLSVFNLLGQEVAILVNEKKNAGNYTITFDAADLASGIYFYRLQSGSFAETRKMILLK